MGESKKDALRVNFDRKMKDKQKEMKKITVLGAGMVGRVMAIDLCRNYQVTVIDREEKSLTALARHPLQTIQADLADTKNIANLITETDLVVGAVPGFMGFAGSRSPQRTALFVLHKAGPSQALFSPPRSRSTIHPATSPISTVPHRPDTLSSALSRISRARTLRSRV